MSQFLQRFSALIFFVIVFISGNAQSPSNVKFLTTNPDGKYSTGDEIKLECEFDEWLGLGSTVDVLLNTGDTVRLEFNPKFAEDIIDPNWGVPGVRNATLGGHARTYGVYCIAELNNHPHTKGHFVLAGGFNNYEGSDQNDIVVVDHDGKLVQGFDGTFNQQVHWVEETLDGGILVGGMFTNYANNSNYDYLIKFKYDAGQHKFVVDTNFMDNLTANNTQPGLNGYVSGSVDTYGKPDRGVLQDVDGSIYVAGTFTRVSGQTRNSIAKLNSDGTLNEVFNYFSVYSSTGETTSVNPGYGFTMSADPDYPSDFWFGAGRYVYRLSKTTGRPTVDCSTTYNMSPAYGTYNVYDRYEGGPSVGILAITVMPNETEIDQTGKRGSGGIIVTGRGPTTDGWTNIVALQDDLSPTPRSKFSLGRLNDNPNDNGTNLANYWGIDGAAFMKGKMWVGLHETGVQSGYYPTPWDNPNYYEGGLLVLNYDGSLNSPFSQMLAATNHNKGTNNAFVQYNRPDGNVYYYSDGIGGAYSGGGTDIISLYVTSEDDLIVGGSYASAMQYTDDNFGTSTASSANPDDQFVIRLKLNRASGVYVVSENDLVEELRIVDIVDANVTGSFGDPAGTISMDNIAEANKFDNNHTISINMPHVSQGSKFITTWETSQANEEIVIPLSGLGYDFYVDWGTTQDNDGDGSPDGYIPIITHHSDAGNGTNPPSFKYPLAGTYTIEIMGGIDTDNNDIADGTGFPRIYFNGGAEGQQVDKIRTIEQWGNIKWKSMDSAFEGCRNLNSVATDAPDLSGTTSLAQIFKDAISVNFNINAWDMSTIIDMSEMFSGASAFNNGDAGNNGTKPLNWEGKTVNVETMAKMFCKASAFNQSVNGWYAGKVKSMESMFEHATLFNNGEISNNASSPLAWNLETIPALTEVKSMFSNASAFNQSVAAVKVDNVTDLSSLFSGAMRFNQPVGNWNVSKAETMDNMFQGAIAFDQDLSFWKIKSLTSAQDMFKQATLSLDNYNALLISWWEQVSKGTAKPNVVFHGGNSTWCMGEAARERLIDNGWGDGIAGGSYSNNSNEGIIDGGTTCNGLFITQWVLPESKTITIQREGNIGQSMDISWGDGTVQIGVVGEPTHTYGAAYSPGDTVTMRMNGGVSMHWKYGEDSPSLVKVLQFGDIRWHSMELMFAFANKMEFADTIDTPILDDVTNMGATFWDCQKFNSSLTTWDVSQVTNMAGTFYGASSFNNGGQPFTWDEKTKNVTNFWRTFWAANSFNQNIDNWDVSSATSMENMFGGASSFNSPLANWKTGKVANMRHMFDGASSFDQDIGGWDISALTDANGMFQNVKLSVDNYDLLLIGWGEQVEAGTANTEVPFHGGESNYCSGTDYRKLLIDKGWGDGVLSAHNSNYPDIVDGGSLAPAITDVEVSTAEIFQKENAIIKLAHTADTVTYYARAIPAGDTIYQVGNSLMDIALDVGAINKTTRFVMWASGNTAACDIAFEDTVTVNVYPKPDLDACLINLETQGLNVIANGTDTHQVKVTVVDVVDGSPIEGAQVVFSPTANVTFFPNDTLYTAVDGTVMLNISSEQAELYETKVQAFTYHSMRFRARAGGYITQSNPISYTFVPDVPVAINSKVELLTAGEKVKADNFSTHRFLATLKDAVGNPVPNNTVRFNATTAGGGADKVRFYWIDKSVVPNDTTYFAPGSATSGLVTDSQGQAIIYATSTKAWIDFTTVVEFDDGTGSSSYTAFNESPITYSYVSGDVDYINSSVAVSPITQFVGDSIDLTISLVDAFNNPCRGITAIYRQAKLASSNTVTNLVSYNSVVGKVSGTTDANGQFQVKASSEKAGKYKTEATLVYNGIELANGKYANYEFIATTPDPDNENTYVELIVDDSKADYLEFNQISVDVVDAFGNPVANANVKVLASSDIDWGSGLNADHIIQTNSQGEAIFGGTTPVAGKYSTLVYLETDEGYKAISTQLGFSPSRENPVNHTFLPGEADFQNSEIYIWGTPQVADGVSKVTITGVLRDNVGNIVPDGQAIFMKTNNVVVTLERGDSLSTDNDGNWIVAANNDGEVGINITSVVAKNYITQCGVWHDAEHAEALYPAAYTFVPDAPWASNSVVSVSVNNQEVATADSLRVELFDAKGNKLDTLRTDTTLVFSATADVSIGGQPVGAEYKHLLSVGDTAVFSIPVVSNRAASYETAVTIGGDVLSGSPVSYAFVTGAPDKNKSIVEVINNGALWGRNDTVYVKVTLVDSFRNPTSGVNIGFHNKYKGEGWLDFGFGEGANGRAVSDKNGVAIVGITSSKIGRFDAEVAFNAFGWDESGFVGNGIVNGGMPASFYFVDEYTSVDKSANMAVRAKWYVLNDKEASTHSVSDVMKSAGVEAWYLSGQYQKVPDQNITISDLAGINSGFVGPYRISFTATDTYSGDNKQVIRDSVVVSVVDNQTIYDDNKELAIRAINYALTTALAQTHDSNHAKEDGEIRAWSLSDWEQNRLEPQTTARTEDLIEINTGNAGVYPLGFVVDNGKTLTNQVNVAVIDDNSWFVTTWKVQPGETITIPTYINENGYDFFIDWGDNTHVEELIGSGPFSHTYTNAATDTFTIRISGVFPRIWFNGGQQGQQHQKILSIEQWGAIQWKSMESAFDGCINLTIADSAGAPILGSTTSLYEMFMNCMKLNSSTLSDWNVSTITEMNGLLYGAIAFNQDLSKWSVDNVTDMSNMFRYAAKFDRDLSRWNVDRVTTMKGMFDGAKKYNNQGIPLTWNTAQVANMASMFRNAVSFDQDIGEWPIKSLTDAGNMFQQAQLSVANYDSLLIGWNKQLEAGNANMKVKFHGGFSEYCTGEAARANLIDNGWGDGLAGGDYSDNLEPTSGIADGGSGAPYATYTFGPDQNVCLGSQTELILTNTELDVNYQLYNKADNTPVGEPVSGTNAEISFLVTPSETTTYYVEAFHTDFTCTTFLNDEITVYIDPVSQGGTVTLTDGSLAVVCVGNNYTRLELVDYVGAVVRWESSIAGDFSDLYVIKSTSPSIELINLAKATSYRAVVASGSCTEVRSGTIRIEVNSPSVGGSILGAETVCADTNSTLLQLSGYVGDIVRWESSLSNFVSDNTVISNSDKTLQIDNITETTYYRALVKSGVCDSAYSDIASIVVDPISVGGTITGATPVCSGRNTTTLTVVDYVGEVIEWESSYNNFTDGAISVVRAGESLHIINLTRTVYYRAVVKSGECSKTRSNTVAIVVDPMVVGGEILQNDMLCAGSSTTLILNASVGEIVQWEKSLTGDFESDGVVIEHTSEQYTTETLTATTYYRVLLQSGACLSQYSDVVEIVVDQPSVGGRTAATKNELCNGGTTELSLVDYYGAIQWQVASNTTGVEPVANDFEPVPGATLAAYTSSTLAAISDTTYYFYRAVVTSGSCSPETSDVTQITVYTPSLGGDLNPITQTILSGNTANFELTNHIGKVLYWESSTNSFATEGTQIEHTSAAYTTGNLTVDTYYRAAVQNGECGLAYSNTALVTVLNSDFGDAPDSYGTTLATSGAQHIIPVLTGNIFIGATTPDKENDGQAGADAGDDDNNGTDDEDGLLISYATDRSDVMLNNITITNNTGSSGFLCGWIDINKNGVFDNGEGAVTNIAEGLSGGVDLSFTGFNYAIDSGNYYVRLRTGTVLTEVNQPTGLASNGEVEDHLICIYPDTILVDDAHVWICESSSSVNLSNCIQYVPQSGKSIRWSMANGTAISNGNSFDASAFNVGDMVELHYTVVEAFCNDVEVDGSGKLYLEVKGEIDSADKTVTFCKSDAASINLNTVLGASVPGTWIPQTSGGDMYLTGNLFDGAAAYDTAIGGDQSFVFRFAADSGTCMVSTPEVTVVITDNF